MGKFAIDSLKGKRPGINLPDPYERTEEILDTGAATTAVDELQQGAPVETGVTRPTQPAVQQNPFKATPQVPQEQRLVQPEEAVQLPQTQEELVQDQAARGAFDPSTGEITPQVSEVAASQVQGELDAQQQQEGGWSPTVTQNLSAWNDPDVLNISSTFDVQEDEGGAIGTIKQFGDRVQSTLDDNIGQSLQNPANSEVASYMQNNGFLNPDGKVSSVVSRALALAVPQFMVDNMVPRNDTTETTEADVLNDWGDADDAVVKPSDDKAFDPNDTVGNLLDAVKSIITPVQDDGSGFYAGQQQSPRSLSDPGAQLTEAVLWDTLHKAGYLDYVQPEPGKPGKYKWNEAARGLRTKPVRNLLGRLNPSYRIDTSSIPTTQGKSFGRDVTRKNYKDVSIKSKADKNKDIENKVKDVLGHIPKKINKDRFMFMLPLLFETIQSWQENTAVLESKDGLGAIKQARVFSSSPWAVLFKVDKGRYHKLIKEQMSKPGIEYDDAAVAAYYIMKTDMEALENLVNDVVNKSDFKDFDEFMANADQATMQPFYDKWMHASANGRYHTMNTVLNMQNDKLSRNLVESAVSSTFTPGSSLQIEKNWKYIVSRNLKGFEPNNVDVENVGWNETVAGFDKNITAWGLRGDELKRVLTEGAAMPQWFQDYLMDGVNKPHEEWGFILQSYLDASDYVAAKKKGKSFTPKAQTHHDGKANGIGIQAAQSGDVNVMRATGQIVDDEGNIVPDGDIRKQFGRNLIGDSLGKVYEGNPAFGRSMRNALSNFMNQKNGPKLFKALAKPIIMETSYGKYEEFHLATVYDWLRNDAPQVVDDFLAGIDEQPQNRELFVAKEMNKLITQGIRDTLDLDHQRVMKKAGRVWNVLGVTPSFEGPLGNTVFMGTRAFLPQITATGERVEATFQGPGGPLTKSLGSVKDTGIGAPKRVLIIDPKTGNLGWQTSMEGSGTPNQFPVLTIQQIDAAIMADTILKVNKDISGKRVPHYVVPVHDAIITDASSVDKYHKQINKSFAEINQRYSVAKAVKDGLREAIDRFKGSVQPNGNYLVNPEVGEYRALWHYVNNIQTALDEDSPYIKRGDKDLMEEFKKLGWRPEGTDVGTTFVNGDSLIKMVEHVVRREDALRKLGAYEKKVNAGKKKAMELIKTNEDGSPKIYQYN